MSPGELERCRVPAATTRRPIELPLPFADFSARDYTAPGSCAYRRFERPRHNDWDTVEQDQCPPGAARGPVALVAPRALAIAADGALYVADPRANRVTRLGFDGRLTPVAGTGTSGYRGDDGPAIDARLVAPAGIAFGPDGSLYIADTGNNRIRKVDAAGVITTIAGTGRAAFAGDEFIAADDHDD